MNLDPFSKFNTIAPPHRSPADRQIHRSPNHHRCSSPPPLTITTIVQFHPLSHSFCRHSNSPSTTITPVYPISSWFLEEVLFEAGYVPSNSEKYPSACIISAVENAFHTTPQLVCLKGALEEVRMCFTKSFEFRDCVAASDCPDCVSLPEFASLDATKTVSGLTYGIESS